jgi:hypothetical protein
MSIESRHTPGPWADAGDGWIAGPDGCSVAQYKGCGSHEAEWPNPADFHLALAATDLLEAMTTGAQLNLPDFLEWIAARLVHVHGENPNVDYVQTLRNRAALCRAAIAKATGAQP